MDNFDRLQRRTGEQDAALLMDCLESAKAAIMARRYPMREWPQELERRYENLQYRIALALYNKEGGEYETSHTENGVTRTYGSADIPSELLSEVIPLVETIP